MEKWFEVFRSGTHTSSNGKKKTWTEADLDHMANSYAQGEHDAPLVVGHPKENSPAYGWVDGLKRAGSKLMAKAKQVESQFAELVKDGRFPKRSISVYPDGTLRHIGFLGAQPPAIKGLKDIEFSADPEAITYEYSEKEADMPTPEELQAKLDAEIEARKAAEAKIKDYKEKADKALSDFAEAKEVAKKKEISSFIEQGIKDGKILPTWKDKGLAQFMGNLDAQEDSYEFSEGSTQTNSDWFKEFIASFSEHPLFKDMTKSGGDGESGDEYAEDEKEAAAMASTVA